MNQNSTGYQQPPEPINSLLNAPSTPLVSLAPTQDKLLLLSQPSLPPIEELAQEELRLAGIRINPKTNGSSRSQYYNKLELTDGKTISPIKKLPRKAKLKHLSWSPDGSHIAFTQTKEKGLELWVANLETLEAKKLTKPILNSAITGLPYSWLSDSKTIVFKAIPKGRGRKLKLDVLPKGPIIQENKDKTSAVRTYQDLLRNVEDESRFEHYTTAQLKSITLDGEEKKLGEANMIRAFSPSPDGKYLLVYTIQKPFSKVVLYDRFPFHVEIWNREGEVIKTIAKVPVADDIPTGFGAVRKGARSFTWRTDVPATLYWVEALDGGDPKEEADFRDQLFAWKAPFGAAPKPSIKTELRLGALRWGSDDLAVTVEWQWKNRQMRTSVFSPNQPEKGKKLLFDRSWEDQYNDPGDFETIRNKYGRRVLLLGDEGKSMFLLGDGASPNGKFPFIDKLHLDSLEKQRLWQSEAPYFESPMAILDVKKLRVLTLRESAKEQPNYVIRDLVTGSLTSMTHFPHPYESLKGLKKEIIRYKRRDGIELNGKLYLPIGYDKDKDGRLPVLLWAYPREFKSAEVASQITDSPYQFPHLSYHSPLHLLTQGYAVLEGFSMPIIGEGDEEPNETFTEQLIMNAKAAIDTLVDMGVADRKRIAVGGHSYGAFMTANLLAHTNFFAAGIARSGAYNRTLTPFGFQAEERTFWEAPETYIKMSPFTHADKIKTPLLLIHGEADNNSGTYPMQSERLYSALKGQGATVRLVMFPHESHSYQAEESLKHMHWETVSWLNRYV